VPNFGCIFAALALNEIVEDCYLVVLFPSSCTGRTQDNQPISRNADSKTPLANGVDDSLVVIKRHRRLPESFRAVRDRPTSSVITGTSTTTPAITAAPMNSGLSLSSVSGVVYGESVGGAKATSSILL
jgi:hypothetical protein